MDIIMEHQKKQSRIPEDMIVDWLLQILEGIDYLYFQKCTLLNLRLENIFIDSHNCVKLADWGYPIELVKHLHQGEIRENNDVNNLGNILYNLCCLTVKLYQVCCARSQITKILLLKLKEF